MSYLFEIDVLLSAGTVSKAFHNAVFIGYGRTGS